MLPTDLAEKFIEITNKLKIEDIINIIEVSILGDLDKDIQLSGEKSKITYEFNHLLITVHHYNELPEYKKIVEYFGFKKEINLDIITHFITTLLSKNHASEIWTDRVLFFKLNKLLFFLKYIKNLSFAFEQLFIKDKQIETDENYKRLQFIFEDVKNGQRIDDYITVLNAINEIYKSISKIEGIKEDSLRIEYIDSGTDIYLSLIGIAPIIIMFFKIYDLYLITEDKRLSIKDKKLKQSIEHFKEAVEFRQWIDEKIKNDLVSEEEANQALENIHTNMYRLYGIEMRDWTKIKTNLLLETPFNQKQLSEPENPDETK